MKAVSLVGLKIQDLRNIDLVDVDFKGRRWVEITGKNGAAKSTVIESLFLAMTGTKYIGYGRPGWVVVQKGKDKAMIKVVLGNNERMIEIKRSIRKVEKEGKTETAQTLIIQDSKGEKLGQEFLDSMINEFTIDPLSFAEKPPKEQIETVKALAGVTTTDLEEEAKKLYDERVFVNRDVKTLEGKIAGVPPVFAETVSVDELMKSRQEIDRKNETIRTKRAEKEALEKAYEDRENEVADAEVEIEDLKKKLEEAKVNLETADKLFKEAKNSLEKFEDPGEIVSTESVDLQISEASKTNERAAKYKEWTALTAELAEKKADSEAKTKRIAEIEVEKANRLKESKLPFKNVTFDETIGLMIGGVAFSQKSTAEKIQISTRIGMELKPGLRLLCIKDGSALDEDAVEVLRELAVKHDYQILVERVGEKAGEDCIVMRSGTVISEFEKERTPAAKAAGMDDEL